MCPVSVILHLYVFGWCVAFSIYKIGLIVVQCVQSSDSKYIRCVCESQNANGLKILKANAAVTECNLMEMNGNEMKWK